MGYPLIILTGKAGTGKDTVAKYLADAYGAKTLALADPLKRLAKELFHFTDEQLWGPSEKRAEVWHGDLTAVGVAVDTIDYSGAPQWMAVPPALYKPQPTVNGKGSLRRWLDAHIAPHANTPALTVRHVLQTLGTEWARVEFGPSIWVDYACRVADRLLAGEDYAPSSGAFAKLGTFTVAPFVVITDGRFANEVLAVKRAGGFAFRLVDGEKVAMAGKEVWRTHASETDEVPDFWIDRAIINWKSTGLDQLHSSTRGAMDVFMFRRLKDQ